MRLFRESPNAERFDMAPIAGCAKKRAASSHSRSKSPGTHIWLYGDLPFHATRSDPLVRPFVPRYGVLVLSVLYSLIAFFFSLHFFFVPIYPTERLSLPPLIINQIFHHPFPFTPTCALI